MTSESDTEFVERVSRAIYDRNSTHKDADLIRLFALARRGAAAADRIEQLEAALRPFACECVGFCKDAKHNYGEVDPVDTCGYGRARAALEERT